MNHSFVVNAGTLRERADVLFAFGSRELDRLFDSPNFPMVRLGELATLVQYGTSSQAHPEPVGVPVLRMNNLQMDGWALDDLKYVQLSEAEVESYRLLPGDILVNRTNGSRDLVGKCEVFRESGTWVFASYLIRIRVDSDRIHPEFLASFLNTEAGRAQILRSTRQILMSNINSTELKELLIPLPSRNEQDAFVRDIQLARKARESRLSAAKGKREEIVSVVQHRLGLSIPSADRQEHPKSWSVALGEAERLGRLDPGPFHPERTTAIRKIVDAGPSAQLDSLVEAVRTPMSERSAVIGMAAVESHTGELLVDVTENEGSAGVLFNPGDILYGKLRPRLNKVHLARTEGACSPEFLVLRLISSRVTPEFLTLALRIPQVVAQSVHLVSGNTLPRISLDDVLGLYVPEPTLEDQGRIVDESDRLQGEAERLATEAHELWLSSKLSLQRSLFGRTAGR